MAVVSDAQSSLASSLLAARPDAMAKYVMCLGPAARRRAIVRILQRRGYAALACEGEVAVLRAIREQGFPALLVSESPAWTARAREAAPRLYDVGSISFIELRRFLRGDVRALEAVLPR